MTVFAAPGTGKSLLAQHAPSWFRESKNEKLRAMAIKDLLVVCTSFNGNTKFNHVFEAADGNAALSRRLVASYFGLEDLISVQMSLGPLPAFKECLDAIVRDHRARHPDMQKEDTTLLYLAVDDLTSLTKYPDTLKAITDALGDSSITSPSDSFFVPILTGSNDCAVTEALRASNHPKAPVPLQFLELNDVYSMIDASGFDMSRLNESQAQELEDLILDIAGVPRAVEQLIASLCEQQYSRGNRELPLSFRPPEDSIGVSRNQLTSFHGRSLAPHLQAGVKHTRSFRTLAKPTIAPPLYRCFRVGLWTLRHL
jgi:hypothetical protein